MKIEVFFDYTCPFCYIGLHHLEEVMKNHSNVEVLWRGCEAHPRPEARTKFPDLKPFWEETIEPLGKEAGLTLNHPMSPIPRSDKAFIGMRYLLAQGLDVTSYHKNIFKAVFVDGKDIEDEEVLLDCAKELKINSEQFLLELKEKVTEQEEANRYAYIENKVEAVPTLISKGERLDAKLGVGIGKEEIEMFLKKVSRES